YSNTAWQSTFVFPTRRYRAIWTAALGDEWYASDAGYLEHYVGQTSSEVALFGTTAGLSALYGSDVNDIWAVGRLGTVFHYQGQSWNPMMTSANQDLNAAWGLKGKLFYVAGNNGTVMYYQP